MIKRFLPILLFFSMISASEAQEYDYVLPDTLPEVDERSRVTLPIRAKESDPVYVRPSYMSDQSNQAQAASDSTAKKSKQGRTSVSIEVGASVASDFSGNSAISTYAAPHVRHQVNDRVAISGGVVMSQTYFDGWTNYSIDGTAYQMPSSVTTNMAYGRLDYRLNERLLVYGAVYTNLTTVPEAGFNRQLQGVGYTVGMEYKVSERSFIQIQVHRSSGYNPFVPYSNFGFGSRPINYFP